MKLFFVVYFLFLPFQWALSLSEGVDLAIIRLVTLAGFLFWLALSLAKKELKLPQGWAIVVFFFFLFFTTLSLFWSENWHFSARKIVFILSFAPLFLMLCSWLETSIEDYGVLLKAYVGGAFLMGILGVSIFFAQFLFGVETVFSFLVRDMLPFFLGEAFAASVAAYPSLLVNISGMTLLRASGVFPDPHMFSYYIGMATPLAFAFWLREKPKARWWLGIALLLLLADLLSFSRGGYVGLMGAVLVFLFGERDYFLSRMRSTIILVVLSISMLLLATQTPFGARFTSIFSPSDGSNQERFRLWEEAAGHMSDRPLLGVGIGNYPLLVKPGISYREPLYAHNLYLDIAVETGLVGLGFFLGLVLVAIVRLVRTYRLTADPLALALLSSLTLFLTHSLFETPLFSVHVFPVLLLLLALGVSYKGRSA